MVCDKCGNDTWYIIVSNLHKHKATYYIQVCSKCGFAVEVIHEVKSVKFLKPDKLLSKLKKENKVNQNPVFEDKEGRRQKEYEAHKASRKIVDRAEELREEGLKPK